MKSESSPSIDSNGTTTTVKAQKHSKDVVKMVHDSIIILRSYENTFVHFCLNYLLIYCLLIVGKVVFVAFRYWVGFRNVE